MKSLTPWTEKGKRELETRIECPSCKVLNYVTGYDTQYFFEKEAATPHVLLQCGGCKYFMKIRKTKAGVELLP